MREAGAAELLAWYDAHTRALPWRAPPGTPPTDPYRVWLSEVMLQQTTVAAVRPRFARFLARWPTVDALAAAPEAHVMAEWAGLGYYARARNLHACAVAVAAGGWPRTEAGLRRLPGLGDYTAAAVAAIAFGERATPVDANIARVASRLFAVAEPPAALKARMSALTPVDRPGDFAQALMDLGATVCTPRAPRCLACPLRARCAAYAAGAQHRFPPPKVRRARPVKRGMAFWLERRGEVLTVVRPSRGLLGGMRALPSSPWATDLTDHAALATAPVDADWRLLTDPVRHGFTHFDLELTVAVAEGNAPGDWASVAALAQAGLPTLFAKAAERAMAAR